jgi:hypothetical protein
LSEGGVTVGALHDREDESLLEEVMDDFMALPASFSAGSTSWGPSSSVCWKALANGFAGARGCQVGAKWVTPTINSPRKNFC